MTDTNPESEPSMEEILASIRRIISDGDAGEEAPEAVGGSEAAPPEAEAGSHSEPGPEDDILDLTQMVTEQGEVVDLNEAKSARGMTAGTAEPAPAEPAVVDLTADTLAGALAEAADRGVDNEDAAAEAASPMVAEPETAPIAESAAVPEPDVEIPEAPQQEVTGEAPFVEAPQAEETPAAEALVEEAPFEETPVEEAQVESIAVEETAAQAEETLTETEEAAARPDDTEVPGQALLEPAPVMPMVSDTAEEASEAAPSLAQPPFSVDELAEIEAATAQEPEAYAAPQPFEEEMEAAAVQPDAYASPEAPSVEAMEALPEEASEAPSEETTVMAAQSAEEWSQVAQGSDSPDDTSMIDFAPEEDVAEEVPEPAAEPVDEERGESLISETAAAGAIAALSGLADAARSSGQPQAGGATPLGMNRTLEELVKEAIAPHLKNWLDANLEPLVERIVREEIQRLRRRSENF